MSSEVARTIGPRPPAAGAGGFLIRCGADLVYVAEDLYVRLFVLTLVLLAVCSGWSVWARLADSQRGSLALTVVFAGFGLAASLAGIVKRRAAYGWLRRTRVRQSLPAVAAIVMMLADGPHSATWWIAFALLFVMASVSSTSMTVLAAVLAAAAYCGGTLLYDNPLVYRGDTSNLVGAAMLVVNALVARAVAESFGVFVLRLHRLELKLTEPPPRRRAVEPSVRCRFRVRQELDRHTRTIATIGSRSRLDQESRLCKSSGDPVQNPRIHWALDRPLRGFE